MHAYADGLVNALDGGGRVLGSSERHPVPFEDEVVLCKEGTGALFEERLPLRSP